MSADLLKRLADSGTPMDLIMEVACALADAQAAQKILEKRREKDRERKAVPRNSTESSEPLETPSPFEVSPQTPLPKTPNQISPLSPPKRKAKKAVSILVPEWMPPALWLQFVALRERMASESRGKIIWSDAAAQGVVNKLTLLRDEGHCAAKLLEKAIVSSHRTVFPDDTTKAPTKTQTTEEQIASLERMIPIYERDGKQDYADQGRQTVERLRKVKPIGDLISNITRAA